MIDHVFIKNFKAFKKESIVLGEHTLFIGTHSSGKTTVLEALDVFFNHTLRREDIRHKQRDVVIECLINEKRYRKVFSPPHFTFNPHKAIGNFEEILNLNYLYMPQRPYPLETFFNQVHTLSYTLNALPIKDDANFFEKKHVYFKQVQVAYNVRLKESLSQQALKQARLKLLKEAPLKHVILGVDLAEQHLDLEALTPLIQGAYQTLFTSNRKKYVSAFPYSVIPLYKSSVEKEMPALAKRINTKNKRVFVIVEGKYDVPWFEKALKLLEINEVYRVIPAGGSGSIQYVDEQLKKAGFKTLAIVDGDVRSQYPSLKRDVVEMYADLSYVNKQFRTSFTSLPKSKHQFFNAIHPKDDVVKKVLSTWAAHYLTRDHAFVKEVETLIKRHAT